MNNHSSDSKTESLSISTANNDQASKSKLKLFLRFWPLLVVVIVLAMLVVLYHFTLNKFNSQVTIDHAEHSHSSPNVHEIVHVRQKLLIGVNPNNTPFSFKPEGELVGFDIDLGKAIARELNVPVEFVEGEFRSSLSTDKLGTENMLTENKVDMAISGITVNRLRQQYYAFSKPYLSAGLVAITLSGGTVIQQQSDLSGKKLALIEHDPAIDYARTLSSDEQRFMFKTLDEATAAVKDSSVDALILEAPSAKSLIANDPSLYIATDLLTQDDYAVMIMRGEDDLVEEVNNTLNLLRQKGVLESLRHKWLE